MPGGHVILSVTTGKGEGRRVENPTAEVRDGAFALQFQTRWRRVGATFVAPDGYADCESEIVER